MKTYYLSAILSLALVLPARAQVVVTDHEDLAFDRPEAWALAYTGAAGLFLGVTAPRSVEPGDIYFGASAGTIPHIDREDTRVGFNGTKFEDLNKSPVFGRLRFWVGLPWDWTLELGWTPPLEIDGVRADGVYGLALERPLLQRGRWRLGARLFAQAAHFEGDITCPESILRFEPGSPQNPFGCRAASRDDVELDHYGIELSGAYQLSNHWTSFAGVAFTRLDGFVQINAPVFSVIDRSTRATEGNLKTYRLGLTYDAAQNWLLTLSADYTPLQVRRPPLFESETDPFWSVRLIGRYAF